MVTDHSSTATTGLTVQQATPQILQRGFKGARERIKSSKNWIVRKKSEHDCEHRLVSQSVSSIKIRHPAPSGGYFKSYELNKSIKLNSQAAKEDKQLSEAKQQALNLARIGIHIEELSRSFAQISTPNESKVNIVAEEINGSAQDLLRLAFSYAHKWRTSRRIGVAQSSGYDKDTAVSVPEGENPEAQYLFHPKTLEQMDSSRQTARNDRLLRTAITNRQPTNY
ncbi:hypothetical protein BB559_002143 [Furculomyces boomerangus]|uniref:Uncharacterized protein n=1 Tax=Furculomyces boomerangus TaxID=61424 RepID=A0A2T9YXS3_9FUNG|nr:hypothetical protein BB559_002143 [Furculomyces boomerangus]